MSSRPGALNGGALALAQEAYALVQVNPRQGRTLAERALAAASSDGNVEAEVAARYALGWSQAVLGDVAGGIGTLKAGIRLAERHGDRRGAAVLRRHLSLWLASSGRLRAAQREIAAALEVLTGRELAQAQVQRLEIHRRTLTVDAAVHRQVCADAARALRRFRREEDELWEARLLFNRGHLHLDRGELDRAEADVRRAHTLYLRAGARAAGANAAAVLAGIAATRGDVLSCLKTLDGVDPAALPGQLG